MPLSSAKAAEYIRNFLMGETLPSAEDEYALHKRFVPEITLAEINKLAREWFPLSSQNRMVIVTAPEKSGLAIPDQAEACSHHQRSALCGTEAICRYGRVGSSA